MNQRKGKREKEERRQSLRKEKKTKKYEKTHGRVRENNDQRSEVERIKERKWERTKKG